SATERGCRPQRAACTRRPRSRGVAGAAVCVLAVSRPGKWPAGGQGYISRRVGGRAVPGAVGARMNAADDIARARELLELGHLRPDKAWRARSWRDRLAAIGVPEDQLVDKLASEIYAANWRAPSPEWR